MRARPAPSVIRIMFIKELRQTVFRAIKISIKARLELCVLLVIQHLPGNQRPLIIILQSLN